MIELAKQAIDAHGGLERWSRFTALSAHLIQGGDLWTTSANLPTRNVNLTSLPIARIVLILKAELFLRTTGSDLELPIDRQFADPRDV